jgi:predicted transcriptional regulator
MKYIVELPPDLAKKVYVLISRGSYENISQFAVTAFQNQLLIEESSEESVSSFTEIQVDGRNQTSEHRKPEGDSLLLLGFSSEKTKVVATPNSDKIPDNCLWGQYNRIFPMKITLRVLANLLKGDETIELSALQSCAVQVAREIGLVLRKEDKKRGRKYGDMLSSALPIGRNMVKTEKRFFNHFVGYYTRAGRIEGAPGALKFLNIVEDLNGNHRVGITESGLGFASIRNPVLDDKEYERTLSRAESSFYIENVFQNSKREAEIMLATLEAIGNGMSSPSELNSKIASFSRGWSPAMINTIRAGVVSRLHELGLINRKREDVRVVYSLTEYGKETLATWQLNHGTAG